MPWPRATDYNAAVQNPHLCFTDADLRQGQAAGDPFGLPLPHSGNFADVYQFTCPGEKRWAVKCFTREVHGLRERYQAVSDYLRDHPRRFLVGFTYLEEGVRVGNAWWPVLKMDWIEGFSLNAFTAHQVDRPGVLKRLAHLWLRLARELREAEVAHGDLQHGNVLLVPGDKGNVALRLIDYDGLWVPALAERPSGESGHPNYQHPQRLREGAYGREVDRFSHLVIYTALRCVAVGGPALWQRYENAENLLFREADFRTPQRSQLFRDLWTLGDDARALAGQLLLASAGPLSGVPLLDDLLDEDRVRPLTRSEEEQAKYLMQWSGGSSLSSGPALVPEPVPALPAPLLPVDFEPTIVRRNEALRSMVGQPSALADWVTGPATVPLTPLAPDTVPVLLAVPPEALPLPALTPLQPAAVPVVDPGRRIVGPMTPVGEDAVPSLPPLPPRQEVPPVPTAEILLIEVTPSRPALPPASKRARPALPQVKSRAPAADPVEDPAVLSWRWLEARPLLVGLVVGGFLLLTFLIFLVVLIALLKGR